MMGGREVAPATLRRRGVIATAVIAVIVAVAAINPFARSAETVEFAILTPALPDGVREGIPIDIRGETVGEVCRTDISRQDVARVTLCVEATAMGEITDETAVSFVSRSVFGSDALRLSPNGTGRRVVDGGVVTLRQPPADYTITATMRNAGAFMLPVLTPDLSDLLTQVSDVTIRLSPFLTATTVALQTMERGDLTALTSRLPTAAAALDGAGQAGAGAVGALEHVIGNRLLADDDYTGRVATMIADIGGLFSDLGALFNGMSGLGATMDLITAFTTPLSEALRGTTPAQIQTLIDNFGGAFHTDPKTGRTTLAVDVALDTVPGAATGLAQLIGGQVARP